MRPPMQSLEIIFPMTHSYTYIGKNYYIKVSVILRKKIRKVKKTNTIPKHPTIKPKSKSIWQRKKLYWLNLHHSFIFEFIQKSVRNPTLLTHNNYLPHPI